MRLRLAAQRRDFSAELAEAINGNRYLHLLERLHAGSLSASALRGPPDTDEVRSHAPTPRIPPAMFSPCWWGGRGSGCGDGCTRPGRKPSDTQLHQIRIASKQLRYAAEAAEPVIGKAAGRTARRAKDLQTLLGDHHDAVAAEEWLQGVALDGTGSAGFAAGQLACTTQREQQELRRRWRAEWNALATAEVDPLAAVTG